MKLLLRIFIIILCTQSVSTATEWFETTNHSELTKQSNKSLIHHTLSPLYKKTNTSNYTNHNSNQTQNNKNNSNYQPTPRLPKAPNKSNSYEQEKHKNLDTTNFAPYMKELQRRIKMNWEPPKGTQSKRVVVFFTISKDGRLLSQKILESSGDADTDNSALQAIELTAPFKPLPSSYKNNSIDIQFTFDYNVFH